MGWSFGPVRGAMRRTRLPEANGGHATRRPLRGGQWDTKWQRQAPVGLWLSQSGRGAWAAGRELRAMRRSW